ncbi:F0F1 ATP synthase subunit epsilon [Pseudooceanicola sp.]|uniref:F0F1 ATP synthase subunit epsilon n=1 Tax=Pseudooceanicola sp. TaxID=1914328 RepID=UPI0026217D19|nr:F0F1 ATP synthase subunit epsilon [Pseudooceanicola sp.]MDF1856562.1 F0F1 ATP synthase subunit epsilon [Pseudooceanicola sp.]
MRLHIVTPLSIVLDRQVESLRAEDFSGSFGIMQGHAPFLTALEISIVNWRQDRTEGFCAVRGGVLTVLNDTISIATREAVPGDDLATLDQDVLTRFQSDADAERVNRVESVQLQLNAIRRMVSRLGEGALSGEFR